VKIAHSSWVVKSRWESLYFWFLSHLQLNSCNQYAHSWHSSVEFHCVFTSILGSSAIHTMAFWLSMDLFWWPGVSGINTASILCYMMVSFMSFKMSWNMYFLNYLCQTWSHSRHLVDSSIAQFSQSLTLHNVRGFIHSKLLITLKGFPRVDAAIYPEFVPEGTKCKVNDVRHASYVVPHCRPPNSGGIEGWV